MTAALVTLAVPCRTDEPALRRALETAWASWSAGPAATRGLEVLVCLNGDLTTGRALDDVRSFARARNVAAGVVDADAGVWADPPPAGGVIVAALCSARAGKALAWNVLRRAARGDTTIFMDADVWFPADTVGRLVSALAESPDAVLASARTRCTTRGSWFESVMAAPYGVEFPNLSPQLYAARTDRLPAAMPENLLDPERWLELTIGAAEIVRASGAEVVVRLPATLRDFFRQRVRIEMGRVQLGAEYPRLLGRGAAQPDARDVLRQLGAADLARLGVYLALRRTVHAVARRWYARGRTRDVWAQPTSTKEWDAA